MKKSILFFLGFSTVSLVYAQHVEPTRSMLVPALKDKITIDGIADETSWSEESTITEVYNPISGKISPSDLSGYVKLCWDVNNLYVFVSVKDDTAYTINEGPYYSWEYDNVEVFLDLDTTIKGSYYSSDAAQYRFNRQSDQQICTTPRNGTTLVFEEVENIDGWQVEAQIPWLSFMPAGSAQKDFLDWITEAIGFDIQICDNDGFGRDGQTSWDADVEGSDASENNAFFQTQVFGLINLAFNDTTLEANAGPDQTVEENSLVTLDASGSINQGNSKIAYRWIAPEGISLINKDSIHPSFYAPEVYTNDVYTYTFKLVINDSTYYTTDKVNINVTNINTIPESYIDQDSIVVFENQEVFLNRSVWDADGDSITLYWSTPDEIILRNDCVFFSPCFVTPEVTVNTDYTIKLVVFDGYAYSLEDSVIIRVLRTNTKPVANAGTDQIVNSGNKIELNGSSSFDVDNDSLTYHWTGSKDLIINNDSDINPTLEIPSSISDSTYLFILTVNDGVINSDPDSVHITVHHINIAPVAHAGGDQNVSSGSLVQLDGSLSTDFESSKLYYTWTAPSGLILSDINLVNPNFTAPIIHDNQSFNFILLVSDGLMESEPDTVQINVEGNNNLNGMNATSYSLFPNPTHGEITIQLNDFPVKENYNIMLINSSGVLVSNQNYSQDLVHMELSELPKGLYLIYVISDSGKYESKRIIIY